MLDTDFFAPQLRAASAVRSSDRPHVAAPRPEGRTAVVRYSAPPSAKSPTVRRAMAAIAESRAKGVRADAARLDRQTAAEIAESAAPSHRRGAASRWSTATRAAFNAALGKPDR